MPKMTTRMVEARALIDECLPTHDFSAVYEIGIDAPAPVIYERLLSSDFSELWLVRLLMSIRSGRRLPRNRVPTGLRHRLHGTGFVILAEVPNEEIVIGVAGQFWRPDGRRCLEFTPDNFAGFSPPGHAKAAWNFKLRAESPSKDDSFHEDKDQVFRECVVEVPCLLGFGEAVLGPHTPGDSQTDEG